MDTKRYRPRDPYLRPPPAPWTKLPGDLGANPRTLGNQCCDNLKIRILTIMKLLNTHTKTSSYMFILFFSGGSLVWFPKKSQGTVFVSKLNYWAVMDRCWGKSYQWPGAPQPLTRRQKSLCDSNTWSVVKHIFFELQKHIVCLTISIWPIWNLK